MSDLNTITRLEIAKLLGISLTKLINVIRCTNVQAPEPINRKSRYMIYDRPTTLAWIASDPLANITWRQRAKKSDAAKLAEEQTADLTSAFLSGELGVSKAQRNRNQLKKIVAKHRQPATRCVRVGSPFAEDRRSRSKGAV